MTQVHWTSQVNAAFGAASDGSSGAARGAGDDAVLNSAGSAFTRTAARRQGACGPL